MTIYTPSPVPQVPGKYPRKHILLAAAVGVLVGFGLSMAPQSDAAAKRMVVALPNPVVATATVEDDAATSSESAANLVTADAGESIAPTLSVVDEGVNVVTVKSGDSLSTVFQRAGLDNALLEEVLSHRQHVGLLKKLQPGQTFTVKHNADGSFASLDFKANRTESLSITANEGKDLDIQKVVKEPVAFTTYTQGTIQSSLFHAAQKAGLNTAMTLELSKIFGWDIDFAMDIHKGDSFKVIYEELYVDGEKVRNGKILAAEFVNQGRKYSAVRHERKDGSFEYYSAEGNSLKKAFLRSPMDFARISSHFNLSRMHPVLHTIRAHKGTDYAARHGTPVKATGDGVIKLAGRQGGYGNVVIIDHGRGYQSLYAHLQSFGKGVRTGARVRQGQVVGGVGSSGLATGPHLHYEFHINGQVRNPVTVALPESLPISGPDRVAFNKQSSAMMKQMATFSAAFSGTSIAMSEKQ